MEGISYELIPWDTKVIGRNIYELADSFDENILSFENDEKKFIKDQLPYMVFCKTDSKNICKVHFLESMGFNHIETQFHMIKKIKMVYEIKRPIQYSLVEDGDMSHIIDIAKNTFQTDRYSIDPFIGKEISGDRYANWIVSTLGRENFYLYKYTYDKEIVGFHLVKIENKIAYALLGGLRADYKGIGIGVDIFLLLNNFLYGLGVKAIDTYISAINIDIFNIFMFMQYQIKDVKTVLRKIYNGGVK